MITCTTQVNIPNLISLVNESKKTGYRDVANLTFASLLHYSIDNNSIIWGWEASEALLNKFSNGESIIEFKGLLYLKYPGFRTANIPVKLLKPWVAECCFKKIETLYFNSKKNKVNLQSKVNHNRVIYKSPTTQKDYLINKLNNLSPSYKELAERYLKMS